MKAEEQIRMTLLLETMLKGAGIYDETVEAMNAFAAYKLEEVREEAKSKLFNSAFNPANRKIAIYLDDLNNILDEKLKELK